jgi:hypothetical protein
MKDAVQRAWTWPNYPTDGKVLIMVLEIVDIFKEFIQIMEDRAEFVK